MFHFVYCTENQRNGMIYVGKHSTSTLDDNYLGSGAALKRAIRQEGVENFKRHILKICETEKEALWLEQQIVDEEFVNDANTYNLSIGGGGFTLRAAKLGTYASHKTNWSDPEFRKRHTERNRKKWKDGKSKPVPPSFAGRQHTNESKIAIGEANSKHQRGSGNSQFGTQWFYHPDLKECKKVKKELASELLEQGWLPGRKLKW